MRSSFMLVLLVAGNLLLSVLSPVMAGKADNTLNIAFNEHLTTLDYYNSTDRRNVILSRHIYDTLLYYDFETRSYKPLLATSWRFEDSRTMLLELRRGVTFHNGAPFTAEDVVYTINWMLAPENGIRNRGVIEWIKTVEKAGPHAVRIRMQEPFPAALEYLAGSIPIYCWNHYRETQPNKKSYVPIGTGPYRFESLKQAVASDRIEQISLARNTAYFAASHKGRPRIDKLVFQVLPDVGYQLSGLKSGRLDWIWQVAGDKVASLAGDSRLKVVSEQTMRIGYLQFRIMDAEPRSPMADARVRQAVAHAIDRQAIVRDLLGGSSVVIDAPCFPTQFGCGTPETRYTHDPEKARWLLQEAGYGNGFEIDMYAYRDRNLAQAMINDLKNVGIRVNLRYLKYNECRDAVRNGAVDFCFMTWGSWSINDVSAIISYFFKNTADDITRDPEIIRLLNTADTSVDGATRQMAYRKAIERIMARVYWLPLWSYSYAYAFDRDLAFTPTVDEIPQFFKAHWR